jgi:aspartate/methionine/tyrosine aminotransferase
MSSGGSPTALSSLRTGQIVDRLKPFGTTIFTEMTLLAVKHKAVNLAQGFPDFDGPEFVKRAGIAAIESGRGQYARMFGDAALNGAIAGWWKKWTGIAIDPDVNVTVTSGCTEAIAAAILGLVNPGEKVILFQPFYDSYRACVALAGAEAVFVTLRPPPAFREAATHEPFTFDEGELRRAFESGARAILVNTPHNPTGKVFSREELGLIAELCQKHGTIAITDEVYECLTFEARLPHVRLATLPGMADRTVTLSSVGKTFSLTGWKIGWAICSAELSKAVRAAHQFLTFATATPLQLGAAVALSSPETEGYLRELAKDYAAKREFLAEALAGLGLRVFMPAGTYFVMADHSEVGGRLGLADDVAFCRYLTETVGVAAIPPSVFYDDPKEGKSLVRFAFCKKQETLDEAVKRLGRLKGR